MDDDYDVIVLGTGLKECILSGLMSSVAGKKVLHLDRNPYYGGESASLNLDQLFKRFYGKDGRTPPEELGKSREYCVDLCPKFLMACGNLVKILLLTKVTDYLEFKSVAGSFIANKDGKVHKVPSNKKEGLSTGLVGFFQKRYYGPFLQYCATYDLADPKTHKGHDLTKMTSAQLFKKMGLDANSVQTTGHGLALYQDESYLERPALEMVERVKMYAFSVNRYGNSPYIYPKWGLGGLPEGFSRRCAVHGGVYMLNIDEKEPFVEKIHFDDKGKIEGVQVGGVTAKCKQLIADPSYFIGTDLVKKVGQVVRCICLMDHPMANTNNTDSCQLIIPGPPLGRKNDIYVCMVSYQHNIAAKGKFVAVMSTNVEGKEPEKELAPALALCGKTLEKFFWVSDQYVPTNNGAENQTFITTSYDATTHFETSTSEVLEYYKRITGEELDLNIKEEPEQQ